MKKFYKILEDKVKNALEIAGYNCEFVQVNESNRPDLGEYQYNGVMPLAKIYHKNPQEIAKDVVNVLIKDEFFKDVNIAGPGFINMTISDKALINFTNINDYEYEKKDKLIFIDYGGANAAKALHVGHMRSANIGEALKRLCNYLGYKTIGDVHLGDLGRQAGMLISEIKLREPDLVFFDENYNGVYPKVNYTSADLGEMYVKANIAAKDDETRMAEVREITAEIDKGNKRYIALWKQLVDISSEDIKKTYDELNCHFDLWEGELDSFKDIPKMLKKASDYLYESNGAKVIDVRNESDKKEMPPLIVIKNDGATIYATRDLATIYSRVERFNPDEIWYVVDSRQALYFEQVFRASIKIGLVNDNNKLIHLGFGTVNGRDGKPYKTRDGGVMYLKDLLSQVKSECLNRLNESINDNRDEIAEKIAISAIKFADLLPNRESDYVFDIEKFCDLNGKTGPYILYSVVRMKSLLNKANIDNINYEKISTLANEYDRDVILKLNNLDLALNKAFNSKSLNDITEYLYNLTTSYNRFYTENIILKETDKLKQESWLYLTKIVYNVCNILLDILAIEIPDKM